MDLRAKFLAALLVPPSVFVGGVAAVLLVVADTPAGHALGAAFVALTLATSLLPFALFPRTPAPVEFSVAEAESIAAHRRRARRPRLVALLPFVAVVGAGLAVAVSQSPPGVDTLTLRDETGLQSLWLGPGTPDHAALPWLTPERDQMRLASHLVWMIDPLIDRRESADLRVATTGIYDELAHDERYAQAGSALGLAYTELLGGSARSGQVYVDRAPGGGTQPAVVFLHGFGGAIEAYLWALRPAIHARGYALVAPSYGAGFWDNPGGIETVDATLAWMESTGAFDMDRVVIAGLSNGGLGVSRAAQAHPWRGVAWLSGVVEADEMSAVVAKQGTQVPMLVLHGAEDDRIPQDYVDRAVVVLKGSGANVTYTLVPGANHFLMFTHRAALEAALDSWLANVDARPPTPG
ncbi:hypothetical protein LBMAG42_07260 [Deltaproteobacteria bacterium]|nr:hypothetical protein LBMAG42_07260 [Deltaproteobacteria bacterium]